MMDYCGTMLQKLLLLSNELACGPGLPRNCTAQHNHSALGKNHSTNSRKNHSANSRKNHSGTLGKTTVAKWQTGWATHTSGNTEKQYVEF